MPVVERQKMALLAERLRSQGKRIVFTNGCFDLIHAGHLMLLEEASALGDILVAGINSDASVRELKGSMRPIFPERDRAQLLAGFRMVDYTVIFFETTACRLLEEIKPHVYVKGGDYSNELPERETAEKIGAEIHFIPLKEGYSTSKIIQHIRSIYGNK